MADRPNILLITSDQHHYTGMGFRNREIQTPQLDRLAAQGTVFNRAYCPNPTCTPTRASIITGMYPSQHGAWSLGTKLPEDVHTVGEDFSSAGYRTALIGKAHFQQYTTTDEYPSLEALGPLQDLDFWRGFNGPFYGFDHIELARNHTDEPWVGQHYAIWMEENGLTNWRDHFQPPTGTHARQRHRWNLPERYHYDAWIAERSCAQLEQAAGSGEPFFLWSSFFDPHPSYLVPEPWDTMYDPAALTVPQVTPGEHDNSPPQIQLTQQPAPDFGPWRNDGPDGNHCHGFQSHLIDRDALARDLAVYYGMISLMDKYIGVILDRLETLGLAENTIVIFTTDHGHFIGQHGLIAKGAFLYEDLVRVPMIARWPGHIAAGAESDSLQSLVDYAPTFLSLCGLDVPRAMTGIDQSVAWLDPAASARDHVTVENHHQPTTIHQRQYIDERYKLTVYCGRDYGELYDLQEDPGEVRNLWARPEAAELKSDLLLRLIHAELAKEPIPMPRVAPA